MYPSAVEAVVRGFEEVAEYRATIASNGSLRELSIEIELVTGAAGTSRITGRMDAAFREALGLTVPLRLVEPGVLPRFEMKAKRFIVQN